jgi:hypothetical protein
MSDNEWITALWYSPNKAPFGQATFAIPRGSVHCELGKLVLCDQARLKMGGSVQVAATLKGGIYGQVYAVLLGPGKGESG